MRWHPDLRLEDAAVGKVEHVGRELVAVFARLDRRSINGSLVQQLESLGRQMQKASRALDGGEADFLENLEHVGSAAAGRTGVGNALGFGIAKGFDEPTEWGTCFAGSLLATRDHPGKGRQGESESSAGAANRPKTPSSTFRLSAAIRRSCLTQKNAERAGCCFVLGMA